MGFLLVDKKDFSTQITFLELKVKNILAERDYEVERASLTEDPIQARIHKKKAEELEKMAAFYQSTILELTEAQHTEEWIKTLLQLEEIRKHLRKFMGSKNKAIIRLLNAEAKPAVFAELDLLLERQGINPQAISKKIDGMIHARLLEKTNTKEAEKLEKEIQRETESETTVQ